MKITRGEKIILELDLVDGLVTKEDTAELLRFAMFSFAYDLDIKDMDKMWKEAKAFYGFPKAYNVGRTIVDGQKIDQHEYVYVTWEGGSVQVKFDDEGVVVDVWDSAQENCVGTTAVEYNELKGPCYREKDEEGWQCINDHTGCVYNDGHNGCNQEDKYGPTPDDRDECTLCGGKGFVISDSPDFWLCAVTCLKCMGKGIVPA